MVKKAKRVLIVCQHFFPENFRINDIADYLANEQNLEIDVLCGIPNYPKGRFFDGYGVFRRRREIYKNIEIFRSIEIPRGDNSNFRIFLNYVSFPFFSLFKVPRLLFRKYDKILIYQLSPVIMATAGIIIGKLKRKEIVLYILDLWPQNLFSVLKVSNKLFVKIATAVSHWYYRRPDKIMVLSEKMRKQLLEITAKKKSNVIVLPQTSEKIYEQVIEDESLKRRFAKTFNIVYAGNISPAQSPDTIVKAASLLKLRGVKDIRWIIVGDGMSKNAMEKSVRDNHLSDVFSFEGQRPIEDIPKYTSIASVFVGCLVRSDLLEATIPAKVTSYIASGRPIVLAMDGEAQVLINNIIGCGFAGPTDDYKQFAENILKVYSLSPKERIAMGNRAKAYHKKHFEREIVLKRLHSFMFK